MGRFRDIPIRSKLTGIIVVTFFVALLLGGFTLIARYAASEKEKLADRLTVLARVIGASTSAALTSNDRRAARETLAALVAERSILAAHVFDGRARPFARFTVPGREAPEDGVDPEAAVTAGPVVFAGDEVAVSSPIVLDGEKTGWVVIEADLRPLRLALLRDIGVFALVILSSGLIALGLSALLQKIVSAPILRLAETMKQVSRARDYSLRAAKHGDDEVGSLIDGFNEMLEQIQARDAQLRLAANALESTGDAIMITDAKLRIVSVNRAFTTMTGYSRAEVLGRRPGLLRSGRHEFGFYAVIRERMQAVGQWHGEIWGERKGGEDYPLWVTLSEVKDPQGKVSHFVFVGNDISQYKDYEARLEFLAHHDALTQLPNRILFRSRLQETLQHARRQGDRIAVMFVDLDRFKPINDTLGHAVGDQLLVAAAGRIKGCLRDSDMVARYGGDEFIVLLDGLRQADDAAIIAEKLVAELARPFPLSGHELQISASVGIACYPHDGETAESLLKNADAAMYVIKEQGRNGFRFHAAEDEVPAEASRAVPPPCTERR